MSISDDHLPIVPEQGKLIEFFQHECELLRQGSENAIRRRLKNNQTIMYLSRKWHTPELITEYNKIVAVLYSRIYRHKNNNRDDLKLYDFFYSEKQAVLGDLVENDFLTGSDIGGNTGFLFEGQYCTESVPQWEKPVGLFDDYDVVGTGTNRGCLYLYNE